MDSRLVYTVLRVVDHERSVVLQTTALGMKRLQRRDDPDGWFTL